MDSVGASMRKSQPTSASSSETQAPGTRNVTVRPPSAPADAEGLAKTLGDQRRPRPRQALSPHI